MSSMQLWFSAAEQVLPQNAQLASVPSGVQTPPQQVDPIPHTPVGSVLFCTGLQLPAASQAWQAPQAVPTPACA
jgi:hypothetical protein